MHPEPAIELRQVRGASDVLNVTFRFLRQNYKTMGKSLLFIVGPVIVLASVSGAMMQLLQFSLIGGEATDAALTGGMFVFAMLLGVIFGMAAGVLSILVVTSTVILYQDYGPVGFDVRDVWAMTKAHFWMVLGTMFLLGFLFGIPIVIVLIPCLGAIAYLVGATYFGVALSVLFPMLLRERIGIFEGMKRCMDLVKDYWWPTFGVVLVAGFVYVVLSQSLRLPYYVLVFVYGLNAVGTESVSAWYGLALVVTSTVGALGGALLYSIPLTAVTVQYFSLVERKERTGLLGQIEAIHPGAEGGVPDAPSSFAPEETIVDEPEKPLNEEDEAAPDDEAPAPEDADA